MKEQIFLERWSNACGCSGSRSYGQVHEKMGSPMKGEDNHGRKMGKDTGEALPHTPVLKVNRKIFNLYRESLIIQCVFCSLGIHGDFVLTGTVNFYENDSPALLLSLPAPPPSTLVIHKGGR